MVARLPRCGSLGMRCSPMGCRRIGVLMPFAATNPSLKLAVAAFVRQLQELAWAAGQRAGRRADFSWRSLTRRCTPFDATVLQSTHNA